MPRAASTPPGGPALTPALAVDYVRELSADVRAVVVFGAAGELLAGAEALAAPARALLEAGDDAGELEARAGDGVVCAVRSPAHAAVAVCGPFAIPGVVREDLRAALAGLAGRPPASGSPTPASGSPSPASGSPSPAPGSPSPEAPPAAADERLAAAAQALISAFQRAFRG